MTHNNRLAQVRCFLLDMDGTFYLGQRLTEGALRFIETLRKQNREFLFLTNNSSKDGKQYAEKIARLGLPISTDKILTSGQATAIYLGRRHPGGRLFVVGTPALELEFQARGFTLTDTEPDAVVLGFDTTLTYAKLWRLCDFVRAGFPYLATHPDFNCPTETGYMPDTGAMIAFVAASTGRQPDAVIGKPNRFMAESAAEHVGLPLNQMCMIGDRLYTDVALGAEAGIPSILVLSGESRADVVGGGTAGAAVAGRLAQNSDRSVLLIEAGPDYGAFDSGRWPVDLLDARSLPVTHQWDYTSAARAGRPNHPPIANMTPRSRGAVRLTDADPTAAPIIDTPYLSDLEGMDLKILFNGIEAARDFARQSPVAALIGEELPPTVGYTDPEAVRRDSLHYYHPVGTCKMGPGSDSTAVVDARGKVHGVDNLCVVDAALMPVIPHANTNLPALAVGERIAEWLLPV